MLPADPFAVEAYVALRPAAQVVFPGAEDEGLPRRLALYDQQLEVHAVPGVFPSARLGARRRAASCLFHGSCSSGRGTGNNRNEGSPRNGQLRPRNSTTHVPSSATEALLCHATYPHSCCSPASPA